MKAKFIYENISDILKPRSEEEIIADLDKLNLEDRQLAFVRATLFGHINIVEYLLERGGMASIDEGLMWASNGGHISIVKLLLKNGADIHVEDDFPLQRAVQEGYPDVVELLLKNGANTKSVTRIPMRLRTKDNYKKIINLLLKYGADPKKLLSKRNRFKY